MMNRDTLSDRGTTNCIDHIYLIVQNYDIATYRNVLFDSQIPDKKATLISLPLRNGSKNSEDLEKLYWEVTLFILTGHYITLLAVLKKWQNYSWLPCNVISQNTK